jgi:hypothetical protein
MPTHLERFLDSELINTIQDFTGTAWMRITSLVNDLAPAGTILDLAGITLCGLIIVYLVFNRIKYRQLLLDERLVSNFRTDFSAEVITRMIGQQTEKSFATLVRAIYNERERMQNWAEKSLLPAGETLFVSEEPGSNHSQASNDLAGAESADNRYLEISKLAAAGMGASEIAAVVKRPQAEVDLCLSLERRRVVNGDESGAENIAPRGKNFRLIAGSRVDSTA